MPTANPVLEVVESIKKDLDVRLKATEDRVEKLAKQPVYPGGNSPDKLFATARDQKEEGKCGFYTMGHQLKCIAEHAYGRVNGDDLKRLQAVNKYLADQQIQKGGQGLQESSGSDGGWLLAPTWAEGVLEVVYDQENLLDKCDKYDMVGPSIKIRAYDETSRISGSRRGGIRGYWLDEGGTLTSSKPKFRTIELIPHKLAVLVYATEELLADGGQMLEQMTTRCAAEEINFLIADSIINGTGAGMPLGIVNKRRSSQRLGRDRPGDEDPAHRKRHQNVGTPPHVGAQERDLAHQPGRRAAASPDDPRRRNGRGSDFYAPEWHVESALRDFARAPHRHHRAMPDLGHDRRHHPGRPQADRRGHARHHPGQHVNERRLPYRRDGIQVHVPSRCPPVVVLRDDPF